MDVRRAPPWLGQHTDEVRSPVTAVRGRYTDRIKVLRELGYADEEVARMRAEGIV